VVGREVVEGLGGKVVLLPFVEGSSTSNLIEAILKRHEKRTEKKFSISGNASGHSVRDIVVFPYMVIPLFISREKSVRALEEALSGDRLVFLSPRKISPKRTLPLKIFIPSARSHWS